MLIIIFSWVYLFVAIFLVGKLFLNDKLLSFLKLDKKFEWYEYFWAGLFIVFGILQIWSIFLPVNIYSLIFIIFLSLISLIILLKKNIKLPKINFYYLLLVGVLLFTISYFASLSGGWPDTYGYHLLSVKWTETYKTVHGLANLYNRLGFNSSFFPFASMIDNLLINNRTSHVAVSLLVSVLVVEYLWIFTKSKNRPLIIFVILSAPIFIEGIVHSVQVSSLSYDYVMLILILVVCVELLRFNKTSIYLAGILSFVLVTIKLSGFLFALVVSVYVILTLILSIKKLLIQLVFYVLGGLFIVVPFLIKNILLSGWMLYPFPMFSFKAQWTMPAEKVENLYKVIKGWAISPGSNWSVAANAKFMDWFPEWLVRNSSRIELLLFIIGLATSIVLFVLWRKNKNKSLISINHIVVSIASLLSVVYVLAFAPDLRFGAIFFWTFFAVNFSLFLERVLHNRSILISVLISLFLVSYISTPFRLDSEIMLKSIRWDQQGDVYKVEIRPKDNSTPFYVYMPTDKSSCGNSLLLCTSEIDDEVKQISPGDISKGFAPVD